MGQARPDPPCTTTLASGRNGDGMASVDRRQVLKGATMIGVGAAAVPLLAACGGGSSSGAAASTAADSTAASTPTSAAPAASSSAPAGSASAAGITLAKSKVPVGGGVVDGPVVVTQPTSGDFKAFSSTCTHMQCTVGGVQGGFIVCPCHGSMYAVATGVPTATSPAKLPLPPKTVTASGDNLIITA
jgi:Rieske Fe-S protein